MIYSTLTKDCEELLMSEFSDLLSRYIAEKNIKVYSLLKYCNLDRSTMYQIINGKRNPSSKEVFDKIAEFLHLTPSEHQRFEEAYLISKIGAETYYSRKSVENYLIDFPRDFSCVTPRLPQISLNSEIDLFDTISQCSVLSTQIELNHFLHRMILSESSKTQGKIALLIQPDYDFLFDLLSSLRPTGSLTIEQTFCLGNTQQTTENHELYSLTYLRRILPLYFANKDYHSYYFYEDINSHYHSFNGFPCLILTADFAITCTSDYHTGIFYRDEAVVSMLWDLYYSYQNRCTPLFYMMDFIPDNGQDFDNQLYKEAPSYILQPEACMTPFVTEEILENALAPDLPDRPAMVQKISCLLQANRAQLETTNIHIYFTYQGLIDFAENGRIKEVPDSFYRPFTIKERISMLQSILPYCSSGHFLILKRPLNQLSDNLHLCVNSNSGYLLFNNLIGRTLCLIINEPGILSVFMDYLETLDSTSLYSGDETADFVKCVINQLKNFTISQ